MLIALSKAPGLIFTIKNFQVASSVQYQNNNIDSPLFKWCLADKNNACLLQKQKSIKYK